MNRQITGPEVMRELRDTMCFINAHETDRREGSHFIGEIGLKSFRCHVHNFDFAICYHVDHSLFLVEC